MPRADHATFQERKSGINCVRVDVSSHVLFLAVVNSGVNFSMWPTFDGELVSREVVGDKHAQALGTVDAGCPVLSFFWKGPECLIILAPSRV